METGGSLALTLCDRISEDLLKPQGFAYTAVELAPTGEVSQVINVLNDVLVARENPTEVLQAMASPAIKIVSLTITEKGYCHEPSSGALNRTHADIIHDVNHRSAKVRGWFSGARTANAPRCRRGSIHRIMLR